MTRKSTEILGWYYNGALFCVDHEPSNLDIPHPVVFEAPQPVFVDEITPHDACDICLIPLNA